MGGTPIRKATPDEPYALSPKALRQGNGALGANCHAAGASCSFTAANTQSDGDPVTCSIDAMTSSDEGSADRRTG